MLAVVLPALVMAQKLEIIYLTQGKEIPPALSVLETAPKDAGLQGARLAIEDNNTTGRFTGQEFALKEVVLPLKGDVAAAFERLRDEGYRHIVADLPADKLMELADLPGADAVLLYNVGAGDDALRNERCRPNVLHLLPSRTMKADALAQYMLKKRWKKWFLVVGPTEPDRLYAAALKRAAKRFGLQIVEERAWQYTFGERRAAEAEVPVFTRGVDYEMLMVADEIGLFGEYFPYRTWLPRPVAGTQGLVATAWHPTHERWGALQLQKRFREQAGRWMSETDYAAWLAIRAIGEAATRVQAFDFQSIKAYLLGDEFTLAGFKGAPLSFRRWNHQLRQPILLAAPRALVAVAPLEGFLHPVNELDTLGFDKPESSCQFKD